MKFEAKMVAHEGQFCTSVSVSYAVFYVSFSLLHDFRRVFLGKYTKNISSTSLRISNIFWQNQTKLQVIYFQENNLPKLTRSLIKRSRKIALRNS